MKKAFYLPALLAITLFCSCQKPQTEAEKNAEIERKVQERLTAEHQAQEQERLTQAQVDLDQRIKDLENQKKAAPAPVRAAQAESENERAPRRMPDDSDNGANADYSTFYTRLEPQGEWRETSNYGYVWQPRVALESRDWRPYTFGRWVYTDAGWTWISEESFGWATYHYGRWTRLRGIGWVWVPGNEWAPAWVSWRSSNDYVGWAPLPPEARFERGSGIHRWADNYYDIGPDQYCFVSTRQLGDQRVERSIVPIERNVTIIDQTINVTNITYKNTTIVNEGPDFEEARRRSQQPIERLRLQRETSANFDSANARPVVRGEVVEMTAPIIPRAQRAERPQRVKEKLARVEVDHGWEQMGDRQAAEKARNKMLSESTPPPNAPSRTFVKPVETTVASGTRENPTATPRPITTPRQVATPVATPMITPAPTATTTPTPRPTLTPVSSPRRTFPIPTAPPATSGAPSIPPAGMASTPPPASDRSADGRQQRKAERQLRRQEGVPPENTPLPNVTPTNTVAPFNSPAASQDLSTLSRRELRRQDRIGGRPSDPAPGQGTSSTSPAPASAETSEPADSANLSRREQRKEERRAKRAGADGNEQSPSPAPAR